MDEVLEVKTREYTDLLDELISFDVGRSKSTVETVCAEVSLPSPGWCCGVEALDSPWFVAGIENLKASALIESPVRFRKRNIFVLANFLDRA